MHKRVKNEHRYVKLRFPLNAVKQGEVCKFTSSSLHVNRKYLRDVSESDYITIQYNPNGF